jgi:hypothetical protein
LNDPVFGLAQPLAEGAGTADVWGKARAEPASAIIEVARAEKNMFELGVLIVMMLEM